MANDSRLFTNIKDGPRHVSSLSVSIMDTGTSTATAKVNWPGHAMAVTLSPWGWLVR